MALPTDVGTIEIEDGTMFRSMLAAVEEVSDIFINTSRGWINLQGEVGLAGAIGPQGPAGVVPSGVMKWRGAWSVSGDYVEGDVVSYASDLWYAPATMITGVIPPDNPDIVNYQASGWAAVRACARLTTTPQAYGPIAGGPSGADGVNAKHYYFDLATAGTFKVIVSNTPSDVHRSVYNTDGSINNQSASATLPTLTAAAAGRYYLMLSQWGSNPAGNVYLEMLTATLTGAGVSPRWENMTD